MLLSEYDNIWFDANDHYDILEESYLLKFGKTTPVKVARKYKGYTSDKLKQFLKDSIFRSLYKSSYKQYESLIDNGLMIPVVYDKSWFRMLLSTLAKKIKNVSGDFFRLKEEHEKYGIVGYYSPAENKIYLIISNQVNDVFGYVNDDVLVYTITHEILHWISATQGMKFQNIWRDHLNTFYTEYYTILYEYYADKKISSQKKSKLKKYISETYVSTLFEMEKPKTTMKDFTNTLKLYKPNGELSNILFEGESNTKKLELAISAQLAIVYLSFKNIDKLWELYHSKQIIKDVAEMLNFTYQKMGFKSYASKTTFAHQELYLPSEVCCITIGSKKAKPLLQATLRLVD